MSKKITDKQIEKAKQILYNAGYFGNLNFHIDDIINKIEELKEEESKYEELNFTNDDIEEIAYEAENSISNDDFIYQNYWSIIEDLIKEKAKDKLK